MRGRKKERGEGEGRKKISSLFPPPPRSLWLAPSPPLFGKFREQILGRSKKTPALLAIKLMNNSCSQKPIDDVHLGTMDEPWYLIKHHVKRHHQVFIWDVLEYVLWYHNHRITIMFNSLSINCGVIRHFHYRLSIMCQKCSFGLLRRSA